METPPPYRPKKSNTGLIIGLVIGAVVVCCIGPIVVVAGAGYFGLKQGGPMITCAIAADDIRTAIERYAEANGGKLPPAKTWQNDVKAYYVKAAAENDLEGSPFKVMPAEGEWGCEADGSKTGFAYNADVAGKVMADLPDETVLVFEVPKPGMNLAMKYTAQPRSTSPKIFNKHRGWFVIPVRGEAGLLDEKGKKVDINTGGPGGSKIEVKTN